MSIDKMLERFVTAQEKQAEALEVIAAKIVNPLVTIEQRKAPCEHHEKEFIDTATQRGGSQEDYKKSPVEAVRKLFTETIVETKDLIPDNVPDSGATSMAMQKKSPVETALKDSLDSLEKAVTKSPSDNASPITATDIAAHQAEAAKHFDNSVGEAFRKVAGSVVDPIVDKVKELYKGMPYPPIEGKHKPAWVKLARERKMEELLLRIKNTPQMRVTTISKAVKEFDQRVDEAQGRGTWVEPVLVEPKYREGSIKVITSISEDNDITNKDMLGLEVEIVNDYSNGEVVSYDVKRPDTGTLTLVLESELGEPEDLCGGEEAPIKEDIFSDQLNNEDPPSEEDLKNALMTVKNSTSLGDAECGRILKEVGGILSQKYVDLKKKPDVWFKVMAECKKVLEGK